MMRPLRRALRGDDEAVSEVIGFVLSFAISSIFLMIAMSSFYTARGNSDSVITATELKSVADRVASAVVEAGLVGQEFPNASMNVTVALPQQLNGHDYYVAAHSYAILVYSNDGSFSANATTFKLDAVTGLSVGGVAQSSNEACIVQYYLDYQTGKPTINLKGV